MSTQKRKHNPNKILSVGVTKYFSVHRHEEFALLFTPFNLLTLTVCAFAVHSVASIESAEFSQRTMILLHPACQGFSFLSFLVQMENTNEMTTEL